MRFIFRYLMLGFSIAMIASSCKTAGNDSAEVLAAQGHGKVTVKAAKYDSAHQALVLTVYYIGGLKEHQFTLNAGGCFETTPPQCPADLVDLTTGDSGTAPKTKEVLITLKDAGLNDSYYSNAHLAIKGSGNATPVSVQLPRIN